MATRWMNLLLVFLVPLLTPAAWAEPQEMTREQLEEWFNAPPEKSAADVNEGELQFLAKLPDKPVHHHHNTVTVNDKSVATGWIALEQCHENLDRVPRAQILFRQDRVRALKIISFSNIGKAWVEDNSIQLEDIRKDARLCLSGETKSLTDNGDGTFNLHNGPFMRKFLDGYYPMRVSMAVILATDKLDFLDITPASQTGFSVTRKPREIDFDAKFEGRLNTIIRFKRNGTSEKQQ